MRPAWLYEQRYLLAPWLASVVVPLPLIMCWRSPWGRGYALMSFFLGCCFTVAYSFRRDILPRDDSNVSHVRSFSNDSRPTWRAKMSTLCIALFAAFVVFSSACLIFERGIEDPLVAPMLALMALVPSLFVTPYVTLATHRPFAAAILTAGLVGSMKFAGALVVVVIYGWDAEEQGRLGMPWDRPDLLVWLFWTLTLAISILCCFPGARRYRRLHGNADDEDGLEWPGA
jgi:hypothetical protein